MNMPPTEIIAALGAIDTATLSNAILSLGVQEPTADFADCTIRSLFPEYPPMVGYAMTLTMDTVTPGHDFDMQVWLDFIRALDAAPKPAVIVIQNVGPNIYRSCHSGAVAALFYQRMGAVGLVTDGGVRDLKDTAPLRFPFFARGIVPSHGTDHIVAANIPVEIGGMRVAPGDLIHGDANGVIKVPIARAAACVEAAQRVLAEEQAYTDFLRRPDFSLATYEAYLKAYEASQ